MFTYITRLAIRTDEVPSAEIPDVWAGLKEVAILFNYALGDLANLDSIFCGISPEEVAELRKQDEEYLRRVNIVPVKPSVAYWKELKVLELNYSKHEYSTWDPLTTQLACSPKLLVCLPLKDGDSGGCLTPCVCVEV